MKTKPKKVKLNMMICPLLKKKGKENADKRGLSLSQVLALGLKREIASKRTLDA